MAEEENSRNATAAIAAEINPPTSSTPMEPSRTFPLDQLVCLSTLLLLTPKDQHSGCSESRESLHALIEPEAFQARWRANQMESALKVLPARVQAVYTGRKYKNNSQDR